MASLSKMPPSHTVVYITRDLERALPLVGQKSHLIITNSNPFARKIAKKAKGLFLISEKEKLDTYELLKHKLVEKKLKSLKFFSIVVFKNTPSIERICNLNNWRLLNPPAKLSENIEEKINQINWLADLSNLLPKFSILKGSDLKFEGEKYIVQFNRAHTGSGTNLVDSKYSVDNLAKLFPNRPLKKAEYIDGPVFTANNIIHDSKIIPGSISYQITGLSPFTDNRFATIGNDWSLPNKILSKKNINQFYSIVKTVGHKLIKSGWSGLYGIDAIFDERRKKFYLLEINARQPASTTFETILQNNWSESTFNHHLLALQNIPPKRPLKIIHHGGQLVLRVQNNNSMLNLDKLSKKLNKQGFKTIIYDNKSAGGDLLRIMHKKGIMSDHNKFNKIGNKIVKIIENLEK